MLNFRAARLEIGDDPQKPARSSALPGTHAASTMSINGSRSRSEYATHPMEAANRVLVIEYLVERDSRFQSPLYRALIVFNVANEIAHKFHVIRFVRNFSFYPKLFLECDHQFSKIN